MNITHSIDGLINAIKKIYNQSEFYDVHLNFLKKDLACPDSISHYLSRFESDASLASRIDFHSLFGAVKYNTFVFYYKNDSSDDIVYNLHLGIFPSQDLYTHLEDADFFINSDVFAICFTLQNDPEAFDPSDPEIYIYSTL